MSDVNRPVSRLTASVVARGQDASKYRLLHCTVSDGEKPTHSKADLVRSSIYKESRLITGLNCPGAESKMAAPISASGLIPAYIFYWGE